MWRVEDIEVDHSLVGKIRNGECKGLIWHAEHALKVWLGSSFWGRPASEHAQATNIISLESEGSERSFCFPTE
jgi:hypothetical protein